MKQKMQHINTCSVYSLLPTGRNGNLPSYCRRNSASCRVVYLQSENLRRADRTVFKVVRDGKNSRCNFVYGRIDDCGQNVPVRTRDPIPMAEVPTSESKPSKMLRKVYPQPYRRVCRGKVYAEHTFTVRSAIIRRNVSVPTRFRCRSCRMESNRDGYIPGVIFVKTLQCNLERSVG